MMKVLFLSQCGKTDEPEDTSYINLFLASLKRHVVPYVNAQVLLYNTAQSHDATRHRVKEFGLDNIVDVRGLYDMDLPEQSIAFLKRQSWFNKIGLNMNMMYDYAKDRQFFDADWIFHTDTDVEFLENFFPLLERFNHILPVHNSIMLTVGGDTYPYHVRYKNEEWVFEPPRRLNFYVDQELESHFFIRQVSHHIREDSANSHHALTFNLQQMKIRNDFVGLSRAAAETNVFNWVPCYYTPGFQSWSGTHVSPEAQHLQELWDEHQANTTLPLNLTVNHDKGTLPQFETQSGILNLFKIQLRGYLDMAKHYSSGWMEGQQYPERSFERLKSCYTDTEHIWSKDYTVEYAPMV